MSITHTYAVGCDAGELMFDRIYSEAAGFTEAQAAVEASREERRARKVGCQLTGPTSYTSADARKRAAGEGWIRHSETHPRYPGESRKQRKTYDLCPECAPKVVRG